MTNFNWDIQNKKIKGRKGRVKGEKARSWVDSGDLTLLKILYPFFTDVELSKIFQRSPRTIENVRSLYGLNKDKITASDYRQLAKKIPSIIIKPLSKYDEDVLRLEELL
jgi:hypothetical protein